MLSCLVNKKGHKRKFFVQAFCILLYWLMAYIINVCFFQISYNSFESCFFVCAFVKRRDTLSFLPPTQGKKFF